MFWKLICCLVFCWLCNSVLSAEIAQQCDGDALTVNCRPHHEMHHMIKMLKKEIQQIRLAQDPNCTVCWSGPCLNDGICVPLNVTAYRCDCPEDYAGPICQTHMECKPDSCGEHAHCYVANHQINCVCDFGYSGNPFKGCSIKTVEACMSGDPHYQTFDGQYYEYMGTCPYTFVKPCTESALSPYEYFEVKAKNELSYPQAHVSAVTEVEVLMRGQKIHVDKNYNMYFNGIKQSMPYYYPSRENATVSVIYRNSKVEIDNMEMVVVTFLYGSLCVSIPDNEIFQGTFKLCGLGGNRDFDCRDDFVGADYHIYPTTSCSNRYLDFTEKFGDSWITTDFLNLHPDAPTCLNGQEVVNESLPCDLSTAKDKCMDISRARTGQGPFAACQALGESVIDASFSNCVFDICQNPALICDALANFAKMCQRELPNTPLDWRSAEGCPELHCPLHSQAKPCATGCPLTCNNPNYSPDCSEGCMEGCECDPGYYLDDSDPRNPQCVHLDECGCMDNQGNYHKAGDRWLTDDCTVLNYCENGTYHWESKPCSTDGHCAVDDNFRYKCECNEGYDGNGYQCSDIDECLDLHTCNQDLVHGACTNTPGSHYCTCHPYYNDGGNCDLFLPLRHCADLLKYHGKTNDGVYEIKPSYPLIDSPAYEPKLVYCDMNTQDGGWTVISASKRASLANKTYSDYVTGFGDPEAQEVWLGLEFIFQMTKEMNTSLRVDLHHCAGKRKPEQSTYCTYPEFKLLDGNEEYAVVIPYGCDGTEVTYEEGWARWDGDVGPKFTAYDTDKSDCSAYYQGTGWWFDEEHHCGVANLNGVRYDCDNAPSSGELTHYLEWNANPVNFAELFLRPAAFPDYEPLPVEGPTTDAP